MTAPRLGPWRWMAIVSGAAAVVIVVVIRGHRQLDAPPARAEGARPTAPLSAVPQDAGAPANPVLAPHPDETLSSLSPSLRRVAEALQSGTVVSAELVASLQRHAEEQRGGGPPRDEIRVTQPMGVVVESDRPTFQWIDSAEREVTVQIFDRDYAKVAESPRHRDESWQPSSPLPRGASYRWQLTVHQEDGHDTVAPAPPAPPALFHIIGRRSLQELEKARDAGAWLEVGLISVREGLLDEGSRALQRYAEEHPRSEVAARLAERARAAAQSAPMATNGAQ